MPKRRTQEAGYTLIELMIVVAIIGILASLAIPAFMGYVQRSRAAEGPTVLGAIRISEEAYRSEFGTYVAAGWNPTAASVGGAHGSWTPGQPGWTALGFQPDSAVRFQYMLQAGPPGVAPAIPGFPTNDFWFVGNAMADLDADGDQLWVEITSRSNQPYISIGLGGPVAYSGWE